MLIKQHFTSPLISKLEQDLIQGKISALDKFWKKIEKSGAPLIESFEVDTNYKLVTFGIFIIRIKHT